MGGTLAIPGLALAGCGALTALGRGLEPLRAAIQTNASGLRITEAFAARGYQSTVTGRVPDEHRMPSVSPGATDADALAFHFASESLRQALASLPEPISAIPAHRRAFVLSTTKADLLAFERVRRKESVSPAARRHVLPALLAEDLAATFDLRGPTQCVSAACISGLLALQQAAQFLRRGQADLVATTGVDLLSHFVLAGFTSLKSLDPDGCRPFDRNRVGLSLGEGAGTILLVRGDLAPPDGWRLTGWGTSNDANHLTGPSRDGSGLALAIHRALAQANVKPEQVQYLHAHGTGTPYNDAMESLALQSVFGEHTPPFSSSKGLLGHTLGAAGILETILCLVAAQLELLPGTPRLIEPDPVAPDSLLRQPRPAPGLRCLLKVNCGFGGTNGAVLLEK